MRGTLLGTKAAKLRRPVCRLPPGLPGCRDMGTVVMGKSEAGVVKKGDTLMVMPNK